MKACVILLLCLLSISVVCNVAMISLKAPASGGRGNNVHTDVNYLTVGGNLTEPDGKDKGGGGWP
jgi:hypothetical protein